MDMHKRVVSVTNKSWHLILSELCKLYFAQICSLNVGNKEFFCIESCNCSTFIFCFRNLSYDPFHDLMKLSEDRIVNGWPYKN
jgi:hypothetical protein